MHTIGSLKALSRNGSTTSQTYFYADEFYIKVILDPGGKLSLRRRLNIYVLSLCELPRDIMYFCFVSPAEAAARTPNNTEGAVEVAAVLGTTTAGAARDTPHHRTPTLSRKYLRDQVQ